MAKGDFSHLSGTDFDAVFFFLFESYLDCKSKKVRNNEISLGEFLKTSKTHSGGTPLNFLQIVSRHG